MGSTVVATVLEYATNRFLEGLTGTKWWDYSRFRFHFGGYVCLPFSAFWGAGAVVIVRWINPLVVRLVQLIPVPVGRVILLGCVILLGLDLIATAGTMVRMRRQFALTPEQMEALEQAASLPGRLSEAILGRIQRRMGRTVPQLSRHEEAARPSGNTRKLPAASLPMAAASISWCGSSVSALSWVTSSKPSTAMPPRGCG